MNIRDWVSMAGLAAVALAAGTAGGTERYVSASGSESGGYTSWATAAKTIQKAVDACVDGDVVWVTNGTYSVTSQVSVTKGVTLASVNGASVTAIDGGGTRRCLLVSASNAVVEGFTIRNGNANGEAIGTYYGGGVYVISNGLVRNCVITNNVGGRCGGVYLSWGGTLRNCLVAYNVCQDSGGYGGGVLAAGGPSRIENCTITQNQADSGAGIACDSQSTIVNSIIHGNIGITLVDARGIPTLGIGTFSYCCTPEVAGTGNVTNDPSFAPGFRLSAGSPCIDTGSNLAWMAGAADLDGNDRLINGTADMGAYEVGFYIGIRYSAIDITWNSVSGIAYQVQSCTNLSSPAWTNVGSSVTASGTSCYVYDWIRDDGRKFYRVRQLP